MLRHILLLSYFCPLLVVAIPSRIGKDIEIPSAGPCPFNSDKLKCTENGFYEMIQCDSSSCFCVDSHNGEIAELTRTTSNKVAPKCTDCQKLIFEKFKMSLPNIAYVPKCDNQHGFYEALQCQGNICFCVNIENGTEITGTRQRNELNNNISCKNESVPENPISKSDIPVAQHYCKLDADPGYTCSEGNSRVMFYFDPNLFTCLAFKYNGCGGNPNRFVSSSECHSSCLLLDFSACAFLKQPAVRETGETITCGGALRFGQSSTPNDGCPKDYKCVMGAFFGFCCPRDSEEKMSRAYQPKCSRGKVFSTNTDGFENILFGKNCAQNFCPNGFKCVAEEVFSHCCLA